ncbi:DNA-methyltransferase [Micromonospora aurantiaca (nom. illeg.)]|uniref:DNA-methyltransferase n=1 Tax=Micromonospora aurantiaca (nom. illeg.) TaxID=47850 RepID=UPI0033E3EAC6
MTPYYADNMVTLYHGDMREVLPALDIRPDLCVADPPYAETSLAWDRWPDGWPAVVADVTSSLWCFGSMRMFLDHRGEFGAWKLSQDVVWRKNAGTGLHVDRFRRIHEHATHWYRGPWGDVYKATPRIRSENPVRSDASQRDGALRGQHMGSVHRKTTWVDTGTRLAPSVIDAKNLRGFALHPTKKPPGILAPLIEYACPEGGVLLDPFAGSGSTAETARLSGRRAVLIEANERYCEVIARRLAQDVLPIGGTP